MCALATVFDVVVCGGTAPGIVAAVRAAREGLTVALVVPGQWLGGSLPSLGAVETHYRGWRAPLLDEFIAAVHAHYRASAGKTPRRTASAREAR
jgi:pyruvate/2-oxoglutarate dehydrogenase complex dihydrolipoamide dehydrogenase (E3) component